MLLTGTFKAGQIVKRQGKAYRIVSVSYTDCHEVDGVVYRDSYPKEEPDLEWVESRCEVVELTPEEIGELEQDKIARQAAKEAEREAEREAIAKKIIEEEARFNQFLEEKGEGLVYSGYDLPVEIYNSSDPSPLKQNPDNYQSEYRGNGLGYWCTNDDLESLYQFAFDRDPDWEERIETMIKPYETWRGIPRYMAGSNYYRWIAARKQ